MWSGEGASQNRTVPEDKAIETCHNLLKVRDFIGARFIAKMNQIVGSKLHDQFEQARAICDVLIAAENRLPNGLMDYYGMIRVTRPGPVLLKDFQKLMNLLDGRHNRFPCCQEAAGKALLAWSLLSKPPIKEQYDLAFSAAHNRETQVDGRSVGGLCGEGSKGGGFGGVDKGKRKVGSPNLHESEYHELEKREDRYNHFQSKDASFIPKKQHNVGPGTDHEVMVISDDYDDDGQEIMTIGRAAKLCKVNGRRVKLIPLKNKKKQN